MAKIRESRFASIENKIVTLQDTHRLAQILFDEDTTSKRNGQDSSISFMARCVDNSSFESEDYNIFNTESFLSRKRVLSVSMTFHRYEDNSYINIELHHGNYGDNSITVRGTESTWVNGMTSKLSEIVDSYKPQNIFVRKHPHILNTILALGYGTVFVWIIFLIPSNPIKNVPEWIRLLRELFDKAPIIRTLLRYAIGIPIGFFPASLTRIKLLELWPKVEIQVGPEHLLIEKRRRYWLTTIFMTGILPLLLSFIYDLAKGNFF